MEEQRKDIHYLHKNGYSSCTFFLMPSILLSPNLTNWQTLHKLGFVNCYLYNETGIGEVYYPNSLLIILNPSYSFYQNDWLLFDETLRSYKNFITIIDFKKLIFGAWFKIDEVKFGKNLRYLYKKGHFSAFPLKYIQYLNEKEKKICSMNIEYRNQFAESLGYEGSDFEGIELASKPEPENYTFKMEINEK